MISTESKRHIAQRGADYSKNFSGTRLTSIFGRHATVLFLWFMIGHAYGLAAPMPEGWPALLHAGSATGQSEIVTPDFLLGDPTDARQVWDRHLSANFHDHPELRCRFPLRWLLIANLRGISDIQQTLSGCTELQTWLDKLPRQQASIVFAGPYMGNPSSMFGHTFLLVSNRDQPQGLGTVIDFAGEVPPDTDAFRYVQAGLTGGFQGHYTIQPFSAKWFDYGVKEGRSLEVYPLNFTEQEISLLWLHLWELRQAHIEYAFVHQNCAYRILALLSAVRSSPDFRKAFPHLTLPGDTIKFADEAGWIHAPTVLRPLGRQDAGPNGLRLTEQLSEIYNYRQSGSGSWRDLSIQHTQHGETLPPYTPITEAHGSSRLRVGLLKRATQPGRLRVGYRLGYHGDDDPDRGFPPSVSIEALGVDWSVAGGRVLLENLTLLKLRSSPPSTLQSGTAAWEIAFDRQRRLMHQGFSLQTQLTAGIGISEHGRRTNWVIGPQLQWRHQQGKSRLVPGFKLSAMSTHGPWRWAAILENDLPAGKQGSLSLQSSLALTSDQALQLWLANEQEGKASKPSASLSWAYYFR